MSTREDKDRRLQVRAGRGDRDPEQEGARAEPGGDPSVQTRVRRPGRGLDLGPGGGPESQPERAGCRCGGGREGPGSLSPEDAGGKGSRAPPERCAPDPRSPGRGGAGRSRGRALTVRSGAPRSSRCHRPRSRGAQPSQQQAAPPRPPRSILSLTRAPQPRNTLRRRKWRRRRRARPTMPCAVTSPTLAPPGGAQKVQGETEAEICSPALSRSL